MGRPSCASHRHNFALAIFLCLFVLKGNSFPRGDNSRKYYRCNIFYIKNEYIVIFLSIMGARAQIRKLQFCSDEKFVYFFLKRRAFPRGDNSRKYYRCDIFYIIHVIALSVTGRTRVHMSHRHNFVRK